MNDVPKAESREQSPLLERLFSVGAHFGYSRSRRHPSVTPFIFGAKNNVEIFDLEKVATLLEQARLYIESLGKERKTILFVGGKNEARQIVKKTAESIDMPYVAGRWIGGSLTNFSEISKRIKRLEELREKREKGEFAGRYTKRERLMFDREIANLERHFDGIVSLKALPSALMVVDPRREHIAVSEANQMGIPVVALLNSDCNVEHITYPIAANDGAVKSISFFMEEIVQAYKKGLLSAEKDKKEVESSKEE